MGWKDMFESEEETVETQQTAVSSAVVQSAGIALFEPRTFDDVPAGIFVDRINMHGISFDAYSAVRFRSMVPDSLTDAGEQRIRLCPTFSILPSSAYTTPVRKSIVLWA